MKTLDLTKPMQTRDGTRKVVSFVQDDLNGDIFAKLSDGFVSRTTAKGLYKELYGPHAFDLVNTPEQYTVTVYVYKSITDGVIFVSSHTFVYATLIDTFTHTGTVGDGLPDHNDLQFFVGGGGNYAFCTGPTSATGSSGGKRE